MARFVKFEDSTGREVYVNPDRIAMMWADPAPGYTRLSGNRSHYVTVKGSIDEVALKLGPQDA